MPITYRQHQDTRDGTIYNCVLMPDGRWWSAENLRFAGITSNPGIYGRLYTKSGATDAVPPGSHLPSQSEYQTMVSACSSPNGTSLKSSLFGGSDVYGFSGLPGGYANNASGSVFNSGTVGYWWTSTSISINSYRMVLRNVSDSAEISYDYSTDYYSVRFIVDAFNEPHPLKLFGVNFDGFERGMTVTHSRPIEVVDSLGGSVQLIPHGPAILDEWQVQAELWLKGEWAAQLEAVVPAYGVPADRSMLLPPRNGGASFPGLLPALAGASADRYDNAQVTRFESQGRKGPIVDLHGYFLDFTLRTWADGATTNPSTTPTVTPSDWLVEKFAARQLQDWSTETATVTANGFQASYLRSSHGRRRDVNFNLDHLTTEQANELVAFYRGVRHNATVFTFDNGPQGFQSVSVYLVGLQLHRTGLHWDGTLETVLA